MKAERDILDTSVWCAAMVRKDGLAPQRDVARPMLRHIQGAACWHPPARGITVGANSNCGHWRMEEAWLAPR